MNELTNLKSNIKKIKVEIANIEKENQLLEKDITSVWKYIDRANDILSTYKETVMEKIDAYEENLESMKGTIDDSYHGQMEVDNLYNRFLNIEQANNKIKSYQTILLDEFNDYLPIRNIAINIIDKFDEDVVNDKLLLQTITDIYQKLPDYWLSCVLMSIFEWIMDDEKKADKLITKALQLDEKNTAVFFLIFNIKNERYQAVEKWLTYYLNLELTNSDVDTFLMIFSLFWVETNNMTDAIKLELYNILFSYLENDDREDIIETINKYLIVLNEYQQLDNQLLQEHIEDYDILEELLNYSFIHKKLVNELDKFNQANKEETNTYFNKYLEKLINDKDINETNVYNGIQLNELIIEHVGDVEKANEEYTSLQEKEEPLILCAEMIKWIFNINDSKISRNFRLNMFEMLKDEMEEGYDIYRNSYQNNVTYQLHVSINDYNEMVDFNQLELEKENVNTFYETILKEELASISYVFFYILTALAIASGVLTLMVHELSVVLLGVFLMASIYVLLRNNGFKRAYRRRCVKDITDTKNMLDQLKVEIDTFYKEYDQNQSYIDTVLNLFEGF